MQRAGQRGGVAMSSEEKPAESTGEANPSSGPLPLLVRPLEPGIDRPPCLICGADEHAHHNYEPVVRPPGCVCNWRDWGHPEAIPPVCEKHLGPPLNHCDKCEHDLECHKSV